MGKALSWGLPPWGPSWKDTWQGWGLSTHKETRLPAPLSPREHRPPWGTDPASANGQTGWDRGIAPEALLVWAGLWGKALSWLCSDRIPRLGMDSQHGDRHSQSGDGTPMVGTGTPGVGTESPEWGRQDPWEWNLWVGWEPWE